MTSALSPTASSLHLRVTINTQSASGWCYYSNDNGGSCAMYWCIITLLLQRNVFLTAWNRHSTVPIQSAVQYLSYGHTQRDNAVMQHDTMNEERQNKVNLEVMCLCFKQLSTIHRFIVSQWIWVFLFPKVWHSCRSLGSSIWWTWKLTIFSEFPGFLYWVVILATIQNLEALPSIKIPENWTE
mgnify:CR=1 FL=1